MLNDDRQLWLQQMAKGPLRIVQSFTGYKIHGIKFHTKTRSTNNKTYSCSALVKGTMEGDSSGVDYYGVLEELLKVRYLSEPIK